MASLSCTTATDKITDTLRFIGEVHPCVAAVWPTLARVEAMRSMATPATQKTFRRELSVNFRRQPRTVRKSLAVIPFGNVTSHNFVMLNLFSFAGLRLSIHLSTKHAICADRWTLKQVQGDGR
jgi:hypothetical protein